MLLTALDLCGLSQHLTQRVGCSCDGAGPTTTWCGKAMLLMVRNSISDGLVALGAGSHVLAVSLLHVVNGRVIAGHICEVGLYLAEIGCLLPCGPP